MAANGGNPALTFSYSQNGLYAKSDKYPVTDDNGNIYYSNAGISWKNLSSDISNYLNNSNTGANPAPLTCSSVKGCQGIFNINSNYNNPVSNSTNDALNYLPTDVTPLPPSNSGIPLDLEPADQHINFKNASNTYRFPYTETNVSGTVSFDAYCFEPNGPNNKGCEDGFICAQMDGIVPEAYQDKYFGYNQQPNATTFQGPSTNICYGGNFNLVNTNYELNKKDPIQQKSTSIRTPLYPERGVTLYQNPGCNRENNPDNKNNKYIGGTIKYEGKGVEIFGNCDVCFYGDPFIYGGLDANNNAINRYGSLYSTTGVANIAKLYPYKTNNNTGFVTVGLYGSGLPSAGQALKLIPDGIPNLYQCITVVRNDGVMSAIEYVDPDIKAEFEKYPALSFKKVVKTDESGLENTYASSTGKFIVENDTYSSDYNYVKYSGDYGLRILPNAIHDASSDNLGNQDITKNRLIKGVFRDPTLRLANTCDLDNYPCTAYAYKSDICPIPCAPNIKNLPYFTPGPASAFIGTNTSNPAPPFDGTVSSAFDGFSSIYIPPHMEVISTISYDASTTPIIKVYTKPIRYEDSPFGDGCFPSFHPSDIFGIYGNSLIAISVRVRKDTQFLTKYVNNPTYNATAKSLEAPVPSNLGTVSTFRPDALLVDPNQKNLPNINKGEFYQHGGKFPIEDAFNGYLTLSPMYLEYLNGKKKGTFDKFKDWIMGKKNANIEILYNSITTMRMNPNINVFSLEWLYVLYYCAMTNIGNGDGSGGCQATYVNEAFGTADGLLGDGYKKRCNTNNMSCLLFNKPLGCNTCNLTGNNMVLASGLTNSCANSLFADGQLGPSSADQFMGTYCAVMSNKIFPFYFSMYQNGNIDCACLANIGECPFQNWLPCSQKSDNYKGAGKPGAYIQCASATATSTRNCQASAINCANYSYQYEDGTYNSNQTANLTGTCVTVNTGSSKTGTDNPPPPATTPTGLDKQEKLGILLVILLIVVVAIVIGVYFMHKKGVFDRMTK